MLVSLPMAAKKPAAAQAKAPAAISVERQQQFDYYWYAAKQAIQDERYPEAMVLLRFCEQLNPQDGATQGFLGVMYDALGEPERAFEAFERAFRNDPHDQWYRYTMALLSQRTTESRHKALLALEQAHRANPSNEDLLEQLRRMYLSEHEPQKALAIQDEIDAIRGYDVYSAYNRMNTYAMWGKPKKAIAEADRWLENDPTNLQFMIYRVEMMPHAGARTRDICDWYERILRLDPRNLMVLNNYAYLLATHGGDLRKAEQMSQITIHAEPDNPVSLDTYGWIMHLQGQNQLAMFYLQKALDKSDANTRAEVEKHIEKLKNAK